MRQYSSVAAVIAAAGADPQAAALIGTLDEEARLVIAAQRCPSGDRLRFLGKESGVEWSEARLSHVEQRAFVDLRRELQRRGLWQP